MSGFLLRMRGVSNAAAVSLYVRAVPLTGNYRGEDWAFATSLDEGVCLVKIIVCVKQILDPEMPPAKFRLDQQSLRVVPPEGIPPVINPYDEQAVELAVRLKETHGGSITVLSVGKDAAPAVKHALSMGADEGAVVADDMFDGSDSFSLAYILSKAVEKVGSYDLILCGRQAADWDEGLVGCVLAEKLAVPLVTLACSIEVTGDTLSVKRATLDGYQVFSVSVPALVTVSNEVGKARLPSGWGIIAAARKQVPVWSATEIGVDPSKVGLGARRRTLNRLFMPARERRCEIIEGEDAGEAAVGLAIRLRDAGVI